jgi:hypothetical protein
MHAIIVIILYILEYGIIQKYSVPKLKCVDFIKLWSITLFQNYSVKLMINENLKKQ